MVDYKIGSHTVYDIKYHFVWVTKYRYKVLDKSIGERLRKLIRQVCETMNITIVKGSVGNDHIHILESCPTRLAPSKIIQYLKGRSSRLIQDEFPALRKKYWEQHLWASGYFCGTVGTVTEDMIKEYIKNQDKQDLKEIFKIEDS